MPEPEAEAALIQHAAALAANAPKEAAAYLRANAASFASSATFHLEAGKVLEAANAPQLALAFLNTALSQKRTSTVLERLFACHLSLGNVSDAARMLVAALDTGYRTAMRPEFAGALRQLAPGELPPADLEKLKLKFGRDIMVGPSLVPHLLAAGRADDVEAIASGGALDARSWDEDLVMQTVALLDKRGKSELALRLLCRCGGASAPFMARLNKALDKFSPAEMKQTVLPLLAVEEGRAAAVVHAEPFFEIAERFSRAGDAAAALDVLMHMTAGLDPANAAELYPRYRERIWDLIGFVESKSQGDDVAPRVARFTVAWLGPTIRRFYSGEGAENLILNLTAPPATAAEKGSRRALLCDNYFRHHIERREHEAVPDAPTDFDATRLAFRYFRGLSRHVPADCVPVPEAFAPQVMKPALAVDGSRSVPNLAVVASLQTAFKSSMATDSRGAVDNILWRYVGHVVPDSGIPCRFIPDWMVADLNAAMRRQKLPAVNVTRFLHLALRSYEALRQKYDLDTPADSLLLFLELMAIWLSNRPQLRPLFAAMIPKEGTKEHAAFIHALTALMGDRAPRLLAALAGHKDAPAPPPAIVKGGPQHVLLIGHASKATGLARNVRVLHDALKANADEGIATELLDFDAKGFEITARLGAWRRGSQSRPIVIYAVNAEDVPWSMLKDVRSSLADAYIVGFFLWEMSRAPHVQDLGIKLIDEVWAPSQYVAGIYAPLAPTHMIGKGLYDPAAPAAARSAGKPFRFLTVFDFDSSIERKNPLAVVQAFQKAFAGNEDVELVVKGLGVKPEHWSNALGHWERMTAAIAGDRRIRLITTRLSDAEMEDLFRTAGCMVSLHRGEGFGYVIADAMAMGMPVIATDYSGNADYCTAENSFPVACKLIPVDPRVAHWPNEGAQWADADVGSAAAQMRAVFEKRDRAAAIGARGRETVLAKYSKDAFRRTVLERIKAIRGRL
jgi:glycosyltransferase involved in cell wall biosynthesis